MLGNLFLVIVHQLDRFFLSRGLLAGRFKVRPDFYPSALTDLFSLRVLENRKIWVERIA